MGEGVLLTGSGALADFVLISILLLLLLAVAIYLVCRLINHLLLGLIVVGLLACLPYVIPLVYNCWWDSLVMARENQPLLNVLHDALARNEAMETPLLLNSAPSAQAKASASGLLFSWYSLFGGGGGGNLGTLVGWSSEKTGEEPRLPTVKPPSRTTLEGVIWWVVETKGWFSRFGNLTLF